jgi:alkanesulfonate monooxygenase SsuD/methylene tetrahydromethanopterin reductase-like flavin-dependent oxidoreductase (luciferase family)
VGAFVNEQVNAVNFLFCHEDAKYAHAMGAALVNGFSSAAAQTMEIKQSYPTLSYEVPGQIAAMRKQVGEAPGTAGAKMPEGLLYGTPDEIIANLRRWEGTGVDRICFLLNVMECVPQAELLKSLRMFAEHVMPEFADTSSLVVPTVPAGVGV